MSKSEKKKNSKKFAPGGSKVSQGHEELPRVYADEEGVETKNISAEGGVEADPTGYGIVDGTDAYIFKGITPGKTYLHPPRRLIEGRVVYRAKYYGHMNVKQPRGGDIVKDAIDKLIAVAAVFKANNPGEDIKSVELSFSIRGVTFVDVQKKEVLQQHPIHNISFSADDKRGSRNMFAFIAKGKPPMKENICYVFEVKHKQAPELTATVGQAFELAYKKFLEGEKARKEFEQLKQTYHTASPAEKEKIRVQLEEGRQQKAKEIAAAKEKALNMKVDPKYRPSHSNSAPVSVPENSSEAMQWMKDDKELSKHMADVQKRASEIELESELQRQKKSKPELERQSSVTTKWENITTALEPFQVEPSLDPETQYLIPRGETSELDSVITELTEQIKEMEEAFSWRQKRGLGPVDETDDDSEISSEPFSHPLFDTIDDKLREIRETTDDLEDIELPANYVMDEFLKAREKARLPKEGTVKNAASEWYQAHHD